MTLIPPAWITFVAGVAAFGAVGAIGAQPPATELQSPPGPNEPPKPATKTKFNPDILGERDVRKLLDDQVDAWNKGDLEGFMKGYWKSQDLSFYSGRNIEKGWDATYERYKKRYQSEGKEMGTLTFTDLLIEKIADDAFLVRGRWKLKLSDATPDGLYTLIVKKQREGWRIVHDHTSLGEPEKKQP
jgi:beta-aspartyl-peptidase (threonine type)